MLTTYRHISLLALFLVLVYSACTPALRWVATPQDDYVLVRNTGGQTLAYAPASGLQILTVDGLAFKDLNRNGMLDAYEDWRLPHATRAADLAAQLSVAEIAGLMLYSAHQSVPARSGGYFAGTYGGKPYTEGETDPTDLTDQQRQFLEKDNLRHVLLTTVKSPEVAARWNNKVQAFCESVGKGIPANNSTDPRHGTNARAEYDAAAGGDISLWPTSLGLAATFDPALVRRFGEVAAVEYRALGITTALSPQVDIATEPRWSRFNGTFGESPRLSAAMAQAYCDGFQTSATGGWGSGSVNAMVKHWPGGGSGEAGRDAHYGAGKFAVYPGGNFDAHLIPFTEGAFRLAGGTGMASAVMPYYTISWGQDVKNGENVGNSFNTYIITDLLRDKYGYDGVVCTDWGVTRDHRAMDVFVDGHSWGVETLSVVDRHYKALMAGVDQFGGNNEAQPILDAYAKGVAEHGEAWMRRRMEQSAVRLLLNIFRVGLFENPYIDVAHTRATVGSPALMKEGFEAQVKSVVMLKNQGQVLPLAGKKTVYVPKRYVPASRNFLGVETPASEDYPVALSQLKKYFNVTDNPAEADAALVFVQNPQASIGYDPADVAQGGNGYVPISLQYAPYTATKARTQSIAGGDPLETSANRSYQGKTVKTPNVTDLELVLDTQRRMTGKPVVVIVNTTNPLVFAELEPAAAAFLVHFNVQDQAVFELLSGRAEPSALLPMQMPASMDAVETQAEDVPFDVVPYRDAVGHTYDFGFGLNWNGVIVDDRVRKFE